MAALIALTAASQESGQLTTVVVGGLIWYGIFLVLRRVYLFVRRRPQVSFRKARQAKKALARTYDGPELPPPGFPGAKP